ncbi:unnamed protein product, partial [Brassica napus]
NRKFRTLHSVPPKAHALTKQILLLRVLSLSLSLSPSIITRSFEGLMSFGLVEIQSVLWHLQEIMALFRLGLQKKVTETELADEITVVCNGMEGAYIRKFHVIECKCGSCGAKKQSPCEWEQHTGCRAKKWKYSVKVKGTMLTVEKWLHPLYILVDFFCLYEI